MIKRSTRKEKSNFSDYVMRDNALECGDHNPVTMLRSLINSEGTEF